MKPTVSLCLFRCTAAIVLFIIFGERLVAQCTRTADSLLLVELYNSANGASWSNAWDLTQPMNTWSGVSISPEGCVVDIFLVNRGLNGVLPDNIGNLSSITANFWISGNPNLTGTIPASVGNLTQVKKFFLFANSLSGPIPATVGGMTGVVEFDASGNDLTGSIPTTFTNLDNLKSLVLNDNLIDGQIPDGLDGMNALTSLWLRNNQLTGTIPASVGNIANLVILDLSTNNLSGCIPSALKALCPKITYGQIFNNPQLSTSSWTNFCNTGEGACVCKRPVSGLVCCRLDRIFSARVFRRGFATHQKHAEIRGGVLAAFLPRQSQYDRKCIGYPLGE